MAEVFDRIRPGLDGVPETLLIPLWARAQEQSHLDPIIVDPTAQQIVEALDYDFSRFTAQRVDSENFCIRSKVMDSLVSDILRDSGPERRPEPQALEHLSPDCRYRDSGREVFR